MGLVEPREGIGFAASNTLQPQAQARAAVVVTDTPVVGRENIAYKRLRIATR
jgi:hypothetical protein